jgi:hypothetical protein
MNQKPNKNIKIMFYNNESYPNSLIKIVQHINYENHYEYSKNMI